LLLAKDEDVEFVLDGEVIAFALGRAANHEITRAVTGSDLSGLGVFRAGSHDSRGVGQRAPIDPGTDAHRERLRDVGDGLVGVIDELDLKDQRVLGIEPEHLGQNDFKAPVKRSRKRLGLVDLRNHFRVLIRQDRKGFGLVQQSQQARRPDIGLPCRLGASMG